MDKAYRLMKRFVALAVVLLLSIENIAAVVGDNDGAAFITKAEFESLKNDFQTQINRYNTSLDSKIDGSIASYIAGIKIEKTSMIDNLLYKLNSANTLSFAYPTYDASANRAYVSVSGGLSLYKYPYDLNGWRTFVVETNENHYETGTSNLIWYYQLNNGNYYLMGRAPDYIRSLVLIAGSSMTSKNGDGLLTFGKAVSYSGTGDTASFSKGSLSTSVDDTGRISYLNSSGTGWSTQTIYYTFLKIYIGGTFTDYKYIVPAGTINTTLYASDYDKRGTRNWEYWTTHDTTANFNPVASAINATAKLVDDIPVFRFKRISKNINTFKSYPAYSIGWDVPYYGGLPLCAAVYTGTCSFSIKLNNAAYLTIKDDSPCKNLPAQSDPGVAITLNNSSTSATYVELAANTSTKLTFHTTLGHNYYIKITPKTSTATVKITAIDDKMTNTGV